MLNGKKKENAKEKDGAKNSIDRREREHLQKTLTEMMSHGLWVFSLVRALPCTHLTAVLLLFAKDTRVRARDT